ncbi:MAG: glycosyltransferase [Eubacteriaceae bacterium]|nr:glycosyltransferase [Eubacteriaceae bacterium]
MKTAVLIPCYNESQTVEKVIKDFREALPDADIYVYDNNSSDGTDEIARNAGAIVRYEYRQGKGNVVRSMFRDIDADCYIMVDGDDTYPAEFAKDLEKAVLEGKADMSIGDRLSATYFEENKRPFHNMGNKLVRGLINVLYKSDVRDIMTGMRGFSYDFVKSFPVLSEGFEIETEMTIFALDHNFKLKEIPIQYRDRPEGSESKLNTYSDGAKVLRTIMRLFRDTKPFAFFTGTSMIILAGSGALFLPVLKEYRKTGKVKRFPTLIVTSAAATVGVMNFFSGVVLQVLRKQHMQNFEQNLNTIRHQKRLLDAEEAKKSEKTK